MKKRENGVSLQTGKKVFPVQFSIITQRCATILQNSIFILFDVELPGKAWQVFLG